MMALTATWTVTWRDMVAHYQGGPRARCYFAPRNLYEKRKKETWKERERRLRQRSRMGRRIG